jgi:hypothetical protein
MRGGSSRSQRSSPSLSRKLTLKPHRSIGDLLPAYDKLRDTFLQLLAEAHPGVDLRDEAIKLACVLGYVRHARGLYG